MVRTASTMMPLGTSAPDFSLANIDGKTVSLADYEGKALLVIFMCNHCPYVIHLQSAISQFARDYIPKGLEVVGISSNDVEAYPQDGFELMKETAAKAGFTFPYLFDEHQAAAIAYRAACTPDFFLFDKEHKLVYRGQFDDSRPKTDLPITGKDLRGAASAVLAGDPIVEIQKPSIGCNIKWKPGNEPDYFTGAATA
ncbi:thioredoxin family protein [Planctomicrobium sp. SH668]|uniref:thioredoxin family protein n=1 Tax=Planctomicrobium sp. SH668 TaxID=3448126 RepID=UPI003F5BBD46